MKRAAIMSLQLLSLSVKRKIHYPFKSIQLIERSNYLNMDSCHKLIERMRQICVNTPLKSLLHIVAG